MLNDVEKEGSLAHGGTGRDDKHLARLEAVALAVQLVKAHRKSLNLPLAGDKLLKRRHSLPDNAGNALPVLVVFAPFPYLENMGFHGVQQGRHVLRIVKGLGHGLGGNVDDGAQEGLVPEGVQVMLEIGPVVVNV